MDPGGVEVDSGTIVGVAVGVGLFPPHRNGVGGSAWLGIGSIPTPHVSRSQMQKDPLYTYRR